MIDIKFIREHAGEAKEGMRKKNADASVIDRLLDVDGKRRATIERINEKQAERNTISASIPNLSGSEKDAQLKASTALKDTLKADEDELHALESEFQSLMYRIPNIPLPDIPVGKSNAENRVVREVLPKRDFSFKPKDYIELGDTLDLIDTERASKVSGSRFGYLKHEAPLLEFALVQFAFSRLLNEGWIANIIQERNLNVSPKAFIPLVPPVLIRPEVYRGMGRLDPGQEEERYHLEKDDLYLVGSGEHTTGPMHMDETFLEEHLPHRHIAFSTCFRREAGSYGKDTRGILRVHQFDKLEMFVFSNQETSGHEHELLVAIQEELMKELGIPYRVVFICTGDMGWPDAKQYDVEAWMPGQNEFRETHSASNTTDFQSRRLNMKYRNKKGSKDFIHTLNATAFAIGRMLIAILENYQEEDGSVKIPDVLVSHMHGITHISPRK